MQAGGEHGIGGGGEYGGGNDAQLDLTNVLYHKTLGGKYVPGAMFFDLVDLVHGVIGAAALSYRSANTSARKSS
jgi:hypothetical protein